MALLFSHVYIEWQEKRKIQISVYSDVSIHHSSMFKILLFHLVSFIVFANVVVLLYELYIDFIKSLFMYPIIFIPIFLSYTHCRVLVLDCISHCMYVNSFS